MRLMAQRGERRWPWQWQRQLRAFETGNVASIQLSLSHREVAPLAHSITQRAAVFARIGAAGERTLVPIDPDRLTAAERPDHAGSLMPELLQALDDIGGHAILELIDVFIVQAARHIDRLLHVATIVEHVG